MGRPVGNAASVASTFGSEKPAVAGVPLLVGCHEEQQTLRSFAADARSELVVCLVDGPPGAGKTALYDYALTQARERGVRVVRATPAAAEASLPYAALVDVIAQFDAELLDSLPDAQARALRAALVNEFDLDRADESHAVARGVLAVLRAAAAPGTVLVAIDDVQWLDPATTRAMLFALRRLSDVSIRFLLTHRSAEAEEWRETIDRSVPEARRRRLRLGPLDPDDVAQLLESRLGLQLSRPALLAVHRRSEGNPLFALEIGRAIAYTDERASGRRARRRSETGRLGDTRGADFVPSGDLSSLLRARLDRLTHPARSAVLTAAAASHPTRQLVDRIHGQAATDEAIAKQVLHTDGARIRFSHPLLASVAYETASRADQRAAHEALASLVEDEDEVALHRARGTTSASSEVGDFLEQAGERAARRGAPEIAAELARHAARLTPSGDASVQRRRLVMAAENLLAAGDPGEARTILERVLVEIDHGTERADVLWRLADAVGDDLDLSTQLSEQALAEAGDDPDLQATIRVALATFTWLSGKLAASAEHVREAARLAAQSGNDQMLAVALGEVLHAEAVLGVSSDPAVVERVLELERRIGSFPPGTRPSFQLAIVYVYTDRLDEARPLLEAELQRVAASGDENARVAVLFRLGELELRAGNWGRALRLATESASLAAQAGIEQEQCVALTALGAVAAHLGRADDATAAARKALDIAEAGGDRMSILRCRGVLGFVELSSGNAEGAHAWLAPAMDDIVDMDIGELSISGVVQNELDALVATGRLEEAETVVGFIQSKAALRGRAWHSAVAARGRALLAASAGDAESALGWIDRAVVAHARLPQPFELGRTLLAKGTIERRNRRRAAARASIAEALEIFDGLGAALWAEKAAAELARISGRSSVAGSLTEAEKRVAALVAEGLSNAEVARRLFVTVRTVEAHLSRIYEKLGLRSRVDIARWLNAQQHGD